MEPTPKHKGKLSFVPINILEPVILDALEPGAEPRKYGKTHAPINILPLWEIDCSIVSDEQPPSAEGAK